MALPTASDNKFPKVIVTEGSAPSSPASGNQSLFIDSSDHKLKRVNSSGTVTTIESAGGGSTSLLLDYSLGSDITNQAITAGTFFDVIANQNFTKVGSGTLIWVIVRGFGFYADGHTQQYLTRINIDSGGTPVLKYMPGINDNQSGSNSRQNVLVGGSILISGLSAATHTIKVQTTSVTSNDHFYCRASTNGPTTGAEFLNVQVIELP